MQIQINSDAHIDATGPLATQVESAVQQAVGRFSSRITRVEVHLTDENSQKGGADDKRCMMEARIEGLQPTAVTHQASTVQAAVDGAADKLKRALTSIVERLRDHR